MYSRDEKGCEFGSGAEECSIENWSDFCKKCKDMKFEYIHLAEPIDETFNKTARRLLDIDPQGQKLSQ